MHRRHTLTFSDDASLTQQANWSLWCFLQMFRMTCEQFGRKAVKVESIKSNINPPLTQAQQLKCYLTRNDSVFNAHICQHGRSHDPVRLVQGETSPRGMIALFKLLRRNKKSSTNGYTCLLCTNVTSCEVLEAEFWIFNGARSSSGLAGAQARPSGVTFSWRFILVVVIATGSAFALGQMWTWSHLHSTLILFFFFFFSLFNMISTRVLTHPPRLSPPTSGRFPLGSAAGHWVTALPWFSHYSLHWAPHQVNQGEPLWRCLAEWSFHQLSVVPDAAIQMG